MAQFTIGSWRQVALCGLVALLAACGDKGASTSATDVAAQPSPTTSGNAATTAAPSQDATVAEILGGSDSQQPVAHDQSPPAQKNPPIESSAGASTGTRQGADTDVQYARVVSVAPVTGPHQVCTNETVTEQRRPNDQHQVAGTVIGAIAGGVIGNQFGGGRGKTLATVGGAVGGGVVGKEVQRNHQSRDTVTHVVKRCHMVDQPAGAAPIYDVVYAYQGENIRVRLDHDPGDRLALPIRGIVNE
jgi:uncharacterized protein YcfJ